MTKDTATDQEVLSGFEELCARHWGQRPNIFHIIAQSQILSFHSPAQSFSVTPHHIQNKAFFCPLRKCPLQSNHTGQIVVPTLDSSSVHIELCAFCILLTLKHLPPLSLLASTGSSLGILVRLLTLGAFPDHLSPLSHPHDPSHTPAACPLRSAMSDSALCPQQDVRKCWLSDE